jgi:1-acyl-sn-glycerol-3-phosphate acyltransferase
MIWLKSSAFFIFLLLFTLFFGTLCVIIFRFMSVYKRYQFVSRWNVIVLVVLEQLCGIRYQIKGMEHVTNSLDLPVVVLSKHQSAFETIAFIAIFPKHLCFVFKRELLWLPFFGWALGMLNMIHINRSKRETAAISVANQGRQRLRDGNWILIFPEGTRTPTGSHRPYRKGGARLAVATNASVIPVAHNSGRVWPRNSFLKYPGLVTISIGPLISSAGKTGDQLNAEVEEWIEAEMLKIDPSAYTK